MTTKDKTFGHQPAPVGEILRNLIHHSEEPLYRAWRERETAPLYPPRRGDSQRGSWAQQQAPPSGGVEGAFSNTEPMVTLRLLTHQPGRLAKGASLRGTITRTGDEHYTFREEEGEGAPIPLEGCFGRGKQLTDSTDSRTERKKHHAPAERMSKNNVYSYKSINYIKS